MRTSLSPDGNDVGMSCPYCGGSGHKDDVRKGQLPSAHYYDFAPISATLHDKPTDAMVLAGLEEAMNVMRENGVTAITPFADYPSPSETIRRVYAAMTKARQA